MSDREGTAIGEVCGTGLLDALGVCVLSAIVAHLWPYPKPTEVNSH